MAGSVQTVKGSVSTDMLGKTLTHEHMIWDQRCWWQGEPEDPILKNLAYRKLDMEILGQVYYHAHMNLDNIVQNNIELAVEEVKSNAQTAYSKRDKNAGTADSNLPIATPTAMQKMTHIVKYFSKKPMPRSLFSFIRSPPIREAIRIREGFILIEFDYGLYIDGRQYRWESISA